MNKLIFEIVETLAERPLSVRERFQALSDKMFERLEKRCSVWLVEKGDFVLVAGSPIEDHGLGTKFSFSEHLALRDALETRSHVLVKDVASSTLLSPEQKEWARGAEIESLLFAPIVFGSEVLGVLVLDVPRDQRLTKSQVSLVRQIAVHIAWAINDARQYELLQRREEQLARSVRLAALGEEYLKLTHDLRSPLISIGGFARRLLRSFSGDDPRIKEAEIIVQAVEKLEAWIKEHLQFGRGELRLSPSLIGAILLDSLTEFQRETGFSPDRLEVSVSPEGPPVLANSHQLQRVFLNILRNAEEAVGDQGWIWARTWTDAWTDEGFAFVEISNSSLGRPIPTEALDRIFEPFFTTKKEGTGIGLSIVFQVLDLHRAEIVIQSNEERTSFVLKFPLLF